MVTVADLGLVNAQLAQLVTAANFLKDVNASGTLSVADRGLTNANLTRALSAPYCSATNVRCTLFSRGVLEPTQPLVEEIYDLGVIERPDALK